MAMTKQQIIFYIGMQMLKKIEEAGKTRPLTEQEKADKDEITQTLFETVVRFGIAKARQRMEKYMLSADAYQDVQQDLAVIFLEKLPYYDPTRSTPTTYFLRYFNQVITEYVLKNSQHMSQYDANNVARVRAAIAEYESQGIRWDEQMLSTKTGLSPKVVKNTLRFASNSIMGNVDEELNLSSNMPTPEEAYIKNERTETLVNTLKNALSPDDLSFFVYKVNPDGKERTYQQVANDLGMQVREVKTRYSNILATLNTDFALQTYRGDNYRGSDPKVHLLHEENPSSESMMFEALSNVPLHNQDEFADVDGLDYGDYEDYEVHEDDQEASAV